MNIRKYKNIGEQLPDLMKQLEVLYKDFLTESITEEESSEEILKGLREMAMGDSEIIGDYAKMISDRMNELNCASTLKVYSCDSLRISITFFVPSSY